MTLSGRDRWALIVLGIVAVLAVAYLFLFVLDGEDLEVAEPSPTITATPSVSPSPTKTPRPTSPPVELIGDRDPFSIPPGLAPSPTGGEVSPTTTAPTTPPTTAPTTPPTTAPTTPPFTTPPFTTPPFTTPPPTPPTTPTITPPPEGPTDQIVIGGHDVRLLDIFRNGKRVQVEVDGSVWTVEEGATFDDNFKLVKIQDGKCARFLFGDQSFELCTTAKK